jgi:hypothetical protein
MNKADIASYLVSLHTLLEAQSKGQTSIPSRTLAEEYERQWGKLKRCIEEEQANERRSEESGSDDHGGAGSKG